MKRTILITGVSGFIGGEMAQYLALKKAYRLLGVDLVRRNSHSYEFRALDLLDQSRVCSFLKRHRPGIIFHFAGGRLADPQAMFSANVITTQVLLRSVLSIKGYRPRVVCMGTAAEYGVCCGKRLITEKDGGNVEGVYGACKCLQTRTALYFSSIGVDVVVARPFNVLGPGLPVATAGGIFARDIVILEGNPQAHELQVGNLKAIRDFLDIRDICSALLCLAARGRSGEIYNVCSQKAVSIKGLLAQMLRSSSRKKIVVREDSRKDPGVLRAVGSCVKLMKDTGWRPRYSFWQSVTDTLAYYRSTRGDC